MLSSLFSAIESCILILPRLCGPRTREARRVNDWGSICVDEYDVISITGEGTFGQVYKAKEKRSGAICALKKVRFRKHYFLLWWWSNLILVVTKNTAKKNVKKIRQMFWPTSDVIVMFA